MGFRVRREGERGNKYTPTDIPELKCREVYKDRIEKHQRGDWNTGREGKY